MLRALCSAALGFVLSYCDIRDSRINDAYNNFAKDTEFVIGFISGIVAKKVFKPPEWRW